MLANFNWKEQISFEIKLMYLVYEHYLEIIWNIIIWTRLQLIKLSSTEKLKCPYPWDF